MTKELDKLIKDFEIPVLNPNTKYWLVRTDSGKYFEDFYFGEYIGIGYNYIDNPSYLKYSKDELRKLVIDHDPENNRPGLVASQVFKFAHEIKKGDIVIIPNENSKRVAFCEVLSDDVYFHEENDLEFDELLDEIDSDKGSSDFVAYIKRKRIKPIVTRAKYQLDPMLIAFLKSNQTIAEATRYSHFIDRAMHNFYIKDDKVHYTMTVNKLDDIPALHIAKLINWYDKAARIFSEAFNEQYNEDDLELKVNVQSPGAIEFIGYASGVFIIVGAFNSMVLGGKHTLKFTKESGVDFSSEHKGLFDYILDFKKMKLENDSTLIEGENDELKSKCKELESELLNVKDKLVLTDKPLQLKAELEALSTDDSGNDENDLIN